MNKARPVAATSSLHATASVCKRRGHAEGRLANPEYQKGNDAGIAPVRQVIRAHVPIARAEWTGKSLTPGLMKNRVLSKLLGNLATGMPDGGTVRSSERWGRIDHEN